MLQQRQQAAGVALRVERTRNHIDSALALNEDGHWTVVELSADTRNQLIARAQQPQSPDELVCAR